MGPFEIRVRGILTAHGWARTWQVADKLGIKTPLARQLLKKLESKGVVQRDPRYTFVNDISWTLAPEPTALNQYQGRGE